MRRNGRIKNKGSKAISDKIIMYSIMGVAILTVILVGLMIYSKNLSDDVKEGTMTLEQMANIAGNNTENTELGEGTIFFDVIFYIKMKDGVSRIINFALNKN